MSENKKKEVVLTVEAILEAAKILGTLSPNAVVFRSRERLAIDAQRESTARLMFGEDRDD